MYTKKIITITFFVIIQLFTTANISNIALPNEDPSELRFVEIGEASWYGPGFHGRKTASGDRFNTFEFTAAHKTLPFGTLLKVTNLENNLYTIVRINDRGPFIKGRIIDLSKAAKDEIGMDGCAKVRIEEITEEEAEMIRNGIDPFERIDKSQIDSTNFTTIELFNQELESDSKVFIEFLSEDDNNYDFELDKNLKTSGTLKIKIITPKSYNKDESTLYQKISDIDTIIRFYDLLNQLTILNGYLIEVGTFNDKSLAYRMIGRLEGDGFSRIYIEEIEVKEKTQLETKEITYKVLVGLYETVKAAKSDIKELKKLRYQPKLVYIGS